MEAEISREILAIQLDSYGRTSVPSSSA